MINATFYLKNGAHIDIEGFDMLDIYGGLSDYIDSKFFFLLDVDHVIVTDEEGEWHRISGDNLKGQYRMYVGSMR